MTDGITAREKRPIRIQTSDGAVEGCLHISPQLRTLDDLNLVSKRFVTLYAAKSLTPDWEVGSGPLAVNKSSILFVRELSTPPPKSAGSFGNFTRAAIRLRTRTFEIEGFVHVPPGGMPMKRLDQDNHPFVSLTSVLITGSDEQVTTPFLAVNRSHITAAQVAIEDDQPGATRFAHAEIER